MCVRLSKLEQASIQLPVEGDVFDSTGVARGGDDGVGSGLVAMTADGVGVWRGIADGATVDVDTWASIVDGAGSMVTGVLPGTVKNKKNTDGHLVWSVFSLLSSC